MMPLEKQVVSLDLAKKLKELGIKQDSLYYHSEQSHQILSHPADIFFSAFTVAELGQMLPAVIVVRKNGELFEGTAFLNTSGGGSAPYYVEYFGENEQVVEWGETEADARGAMLVCLLENKIIDLPKAA